MPITSLAQATTPGQVRQYLLWLLEENRADRITDADLRRQTAEAYRLLKEMSKRMRGD
jgi:hypothetical protein